MVTAPTIRVELAAAVRAVNDAWRHFWRRIKETAR